MNRQITETIIGALVLLVAGYFFFMAYGKNGEEIGAEKYILHAAFSDITGVNEGSDVRISGVKIGSVQGLKLDAKTYQAEIAMLINNEFKIPTDSTATIVGESLLGGKFVALGVGGAEEMLADGGKIEFTQPSVSLEQLLGKFVFSGGGVEAEETEKDIELNVP